MPSPKRAGLRVVAAAGLAGLSALGGGALAADGRSPDVPTTTFRVPGLERPATIAVDAFGIPHIEAGGLYDAFLVQGFNAARDRLWQIDLWRRRGLGRLAEVFGPAFVERDRAARLFLYRGDMYPEWLAYGSDTKRVAQAFTAGINAYIGLTEARPELLPFEFRELGYRPERWAPADVARIRSHGLVRNVESEVERARVACAAGLEADAIRFGLEPPWRTRVPEGLDVCAVPEGVLDVYDLATDPEVAFTPDLLRADAGPAPARKAEGGAYGRTNRGSNNWVVAPSKSATGRPILANDPHRTHSLPSLRYIAHVKAPGLNVIGAGEPALPGIGIGHNERIAFGLTIFSIDQEDLYVYETDPAAPDSYRYQGRFEPMRIAEERIAVEGGGEQTVRLKFTRHGPVVFEDPANNRAFAVRAAWLEPGMAPYLGSIDYMRAQNLDGFLAAMNRWGAPSENQVYADVDGTIAWVPGGRAPERPNWDGLLPVPGDGRHEWAGFLDQDALPRAINPAKGWFATANQMNLPEGYPYRERKLGFEWTAPYRYDRIAEVLGGPGKVSLADSMALQTDVVSLPARSLTPLLRGLTFDDPRLRAAADLLTGWDGRETIDSAASALFEVWLTKHLRPAVVERVAPKAADVIESGDVRVIVDLLATPDGRLGAEPRAARDSILRTTLRDALAETEALLGPDPAAWRWGDLHQALFEHPLAGLLPGRRAASLNVGPLPKSGSAYTPNASSYRAKDFRLTSGASFRMVLDVGAWDNARAVNAPGQSGDPTSPHYRDLTPQWAAEAYVPLAYSPEAVARLTQRRIVLEPAGE